MKIRFIRPTGLLAAIVLPGLVLLGAGCVKPAPSGSPSAAGQPSAAGPTVQISDDSSAAGNLCDNPYYPLRDGYAIAYGYSAPGALPFDYRMSVSDVTDDSAKLTFSFTKPAPFTAVQQISCQDGSIQAETYLDLAGDIGRAMTGMKMTTTTRNISGPLMPADPQVGGSWTNEFQFESKIEGLPESAGLSGMTSKVVSVSRVAAEEQVTVPAGTYTALKVEVETTATTTLGSGQSVPPSTSKQTQWWVKGVGMVKMTAEQPSGTATAEATEISG